MNLIKTNSIQPAYSNSGPQKSEEFKDVFGDDDLIKKLFPEENTKIIFSEDFMKKSKDFYAELPRLGRELIQNFIDANQDDPGTLNGVDIQHKKDPEGNSISIRGNRTFENPTALYKLDSGKANEENMAGGNGIGLKQTVLVLFRDYHIQEFIIKGKTRNVQYKFLTKERINNELIKKGIPGEVKKGWLIANVYPNAERDFTEYELKTDDGKVDEVFNGLQNIRNYGMHTEHPATKNADFEVPAIGGFKLLGKRDEMGEFFLNGQKFRCESDRIQKIRKELAKEHGLTYIPKEQAYRGGPSGINLWITGDYQMSIDRQPIGSEDIQYYLRKMIDQMKPSDLIKFFIKTKEIWKNLINNNGFISRYKYYSRSPDTPLLEHFIYKLVSEISSRSHLTEDLDKILSGASIKKEQLVACNIDNTEKMEDIIKKGYILVPDYFSKLGIQSASLFVQEGKKEMNAKEIQELHEKQAMNQGVSVPYREFGANGLKNKKLFYGFISHALGKTDISYNEDTKTILIQFRDKNNSTKDLYSIKTTSLINDLRGLFVLGKKKKIFDSFVLYGSDKRADFNFDEEEEELFVKLSETEKNYGTTSIEIQGDDFTANNINEWTKKKLSKKDFKKANSSGVERQGIINPLQKFVKASKIIMLIAFLFLGTTYVVKHFSQFNRTQFLNEVMTMKYAHRGDMDLTGAFAGIGEKIQDLLTGKNDIEDFIERYNKAEIEIGEKRFMIQELENMIAKSHKTTSKHNQSPEEELLEALQREPVEDFQILNKISDTESKQLNLLKTYVEICLGIKVRNNLFLFEGKGAKGINIGGSGIGLHKSMMNVDFFEALETFVHEITHNYSMNHENDFIRGNSALLIAITER